MKTRANNRLLQSVSIVVLMSLFPSLAMGQNEGDPPGGEGKSASSDTKKIAKEHYERGLTLYGENNYSAAEIEFRKSYELSKAYQILYNLGQVCFQLNDYVCALSSFETYLKRGQGQLKEDRIKLVQGEIDKLRPRIGKLTVETNVPGVTITIDDKPRGKTPLEPVLLSAGRHKLSAVKEGKVPVTQMVDIAGSDQPVVKLELVDSSTREVIVREKVKRVEVEKESDSRWTTLSWVGMGTGAAFAVGAGITGFLALGAAEDLKKAQYLGSPSADAQDKQSKVKTLRLTSDILGGAAILTIGATLILTLTNNPAPKEKPPTKDVGVNWSWSLGPTGASVYGQF
jgi:tetratricopeptide (TPR) repeat protein